jgi:hypothetical protein
MSRLSAQAGTEEIIMRELLTKFPDLDPTCPDDVKVEWFKAFEPIIEIAKAHHTELNRRRPQRVRTEI